MRSLAALCALKAPGHKSYARLKPLKTSAAVKWGTDNRGALMRKVLITHWQIRLQDTGINGVRDPRRVPGGRAVGRARQARPLMSPVSPERTLHKHNTFLPIDAHYNGALPSLLKLALERLI
jgi:hypothetical protein